jgi:hypothetical protein
LDAYADIVVDWGHRKEVWSIEFRLNKEGSEAIRGEIPDSLLFVGASYLGTSLFALI